MIGLEKKPRLSSGGRPSLSSVQQLSLGDHFAEFLAPLFHHALALRRVYEQTFFSPALAFDVPVLRCSHPGIVEYVERSVSAARRAADEGRLVRASVCFFSADGDKLDEVCFRGGGGGGGGKMDRPNAAVYLQNFFRETLLALESRMGDVESLPPAESFQIELVCQGKLDVPEFVLVERGVDASSAPAVVEPVRSSVTAGAEVFVKRFL